MSLHLIFCQICTTNRLDRIIIRILHWNTGTTQPVHTRHNPGQIHQVLYFISNIRTHALCWAQNAYTVCTGGVQELVLDWYNTNFSWVLASRLTIAISSESAKLWNLTRNIIF